MIFDILFFLIAGGIVFALYKVIFQKKGPAKAATKKNDTEEDNAPVQEAQGQQAAGPRNARDVRNRFARNQNVNRAQEIVEEEKNQAERGDSDDEDDDDDLGDIRKQQIKAAKRQEKKQQREAFQHMLEQKEKRENEKRNKYEEREKQREEEEAKAEEIVRQLQEEQKKKEEEEYAKWKDMFTVDEAGKEADQHGSEENLIQKFVEYIKLRKVVMLDDLCAEFRLSTKDVVDRINRMLESKKLSGIIDDRGKFIYITDDEFKAVLNLVKRRGRISRTDLVMECNRLIKMNPSEEDKAKLKKEESNLLQQLESDLKAIEEQATA